MNLCSGKEDFCVTIECIVAKARVCGLCKGVYKHSVGEEAQNEMWTPVYFNQDFKCCVYNFSFVVKCVIHNYC